MDIRDGNNIVKSDDVPAGLIGISDRFAIINRLITRDLNKHTSAPPFYIYNKYDIRKFLRHPGKYEKQLRRAIRYIYNASSHFRRLIQYFAGLTDLAYIVEPYRIDPQKANERTTKLNYRRVLNTLSIMSIKTQVPKIITVCLREDVFYGTLWITQDHIAIQQLPSDFCQISSIEGNVPNVSFNFTYFDIHDDLLDNYPEEFRIKYNIYRNSKEGALSPWIELDSPTSFAIKCNIDILDYAIPPFVGLLREVFELEDYKELKLARTALENYAMIFMKIPLKDGEWGIDLKKAKEFWKNLDAVLPEEVGSVLTPMDIGKVSFEKTHTGDTDTVADAEQALYSAAGVSSHLFNNTKPSANALLLSIKADQAITYGIVKSVQDMINRFIQSLSYGKNFKVNILDVSTFNRKEVGDMYLKAATYGLPTISAFAASQGIGQAELDSMSFLEGEVLDLPKLFKPLRSSAQMSSDDVDGGGATDEGGAPQKDPSELTDSGEQSSEDKDDWG